VDRFVLENGLEVWHEERRALSHPSVCCAPALAMRRDIDMGMWLWQREQWTVEPA
jgi:hypothetical protein